MDASLNETLNRLPKGSLRPQSTVLVLTGAGISAESGIPTFRGSEGYWSVGSKNYMPEEMATRRMFTAHPDEVWRWYLYRFGLCRHALPNRAHTALVDLEKALGARFSLVTQNIDGLHRRAGSTAERTYCIHGDSAYVRCSHECGHGLSALPDVEFSSLDVEFTEGMRDQLKCVHCGAWLRPHVLWFDEYYDEENYRADSAMRAASQADLLLVIGTSGATNLPMQIATLCARRGAAIIDVNPEPNPFGTIAENAKCGLSIRQTASEAVPALVEYLVSLVQSSP